MRGEVLKFADMAAAEWNGCFGDEAENHAYYAACEDLPDLRYRMGALRIVENGRTLAVAPWFLLDYRLDTSLQGRARQFTDKIAAHLPRLLSLRALALGSPLAERCHIGFAPDLTPSQREAAFKFLMQTLDQHGRSLGASLTGIKDLAAPDEAGLVATLTEAGFARMASLPVAIVDLPFATPDEYLASLSPNMRSTMRRKLKRRARVRFELRENVEGLESQLAGLYRATQAQSGEDYGDLEHLPEGYFGAVLKALPGRALVSLYWVDDTLAAFNLLLLEPNRTIDKFVGMRYPLAREHDLYYLRWMDAVSYCLQNHIPALQAGQTAYREKLRLGARLVESAIYFKHRNPLLNTALRLLSRYIAFDDADPTLKALKS